MFQSIFVKYLCIHRALNAVSLSGWPLYLCFICCLQSGLSFQGSGSNHGEPSLPDHVRTAGSHPGSPPLCAGEAPGRWHWFCLSCLQQRWFPWVILQTAVLWKQIASLCPSSLQIPSSSLWLKKKVCISWWWWWGKSIM